MALVTIKGETSQSTSLSRIPTSPATYNQSDYNQITDVITQNLNNLATPSAQEISETLVEIQTASFTVGSASGLILVNTTAAVVVATLQPSTNYIGRVLIFTRITAGPNNLTIDADGSETIGGAANITMPNQWQTIVLKSTSNGSGTGTAWVVVANSNSIVSNFSYSPGSFTLETETFKVQVQHLKLTGTQRVILRGTSRLSIIN